MVNTAVDNSVQSLRPSVVVTAPPATASERDKDAFHGEAVATIREHGLAILENVIPAPVIDDVLRHFKTTYDTYMQPGQAKIFRNFQDDPKRAQIPVAPTGAMANPLMFANPVVMRLVHHFIGENAIIGEMGAVISHPGSKPQYIHRDSTFLFGGIPGEIDLPPHSLNIVVPLMDVPFERGPTEYWPGSHRQTDAAAVTAVPPQRTPMKAGSVFMLDGRLLHRGGANESDVVRPTVYIDYQRPWYFESSGYAHKPQVRVTPRMIERFAPEHRALFESGGRLNRAGLADSVDELLTRWVGRFKNQVIEPLKRRR